MRKSISLIAVVILLASCGSGGDSGIENGQLNADRGKKWNSVQPHGMALVPGGAFIMGKAEEDIAGQENAPTKTVTVRTFYMDETEITNGEYRVFTNWVRDSVTRSKLAILAEELGETPGAGGIGEYAFVDANTDDLGVYEQYMYDNYYSFGDSETRRLNWDEPLIWDTRDYPDEYYTEIMDTMYVSIEETYNGMRSIDVDHLVYTYSWMDIGQAAKAAPGRRAEFIYEEEVAIYPDTTVWIKDFNYSYNEPMHNDYFWHEAYSDYPVVGVNWRQAQAFAQWRTQIHNAYQRERNEQHVSNYRLPTEAEWEYAARGGLESATYPWGGPYTKNERGCFMANFKPMRGDYAADQALYTVEAESYEPNDYNLYNMAGNVSEWVYSSYDPTSYEYFSSMNPSVNAQENMKKVVRGGSWKDVAYFLQVSTRDYEFADSARSYIGFRTVQDYKGSDMRMNQNR